MQKKLYISAKYNHLTIHLYCKCQYGNKSQLKKQVKLAHRHLQSVIGHLGQTSSRRESQQ